MCRNSNKCSEGKGKQLLLRTQRFCSNNNGPRCVAQTLRCFISRRSLTTTLYLTKHVSTYISDIHTCDAVTCDQKNTPCSPEDLGQILRERGEEMRKVGVVQLPVDRLFTLHTVTTCVLTFSRIASTAVTTTTVPLDLAAATVFVFLPA